MFKNVSGQKLSVYCFNSTTNLPVTGDAANLTAYESLDDGSVTGLTDTSASEQSASNAPGFYLFDLSQAETNASKIMFSCVTVTADVVCLCMPAVVYTTPPNFTATAIDSSGALTLTAGERNSIAAAILDLTSAIETGLTVRQALRLGAAADAGKASGMGTGTAVLRNAVADSKARITATVDADGNRTAVTTDLT